MTSPSVTPITASRFAPPPGQDDPRKRMAGEAAVEFVKDGMVLGLGTGSTVYYTIRKIGQLVKEKEIDVIAIPTSLDTRNYATSLGIPLTTLDEHPSIDLTIDGADEVDPDLNLIKGLGGALFMEKIVASSSAMEVIVIDPGKQVEKLGRGKLPVEIMKFGHGSTTRRIGELGLNPTLRTSSPTSPRGALPFVTDNNGVILDCLPGPLDDAAAMDREINAVTGVLENGLFIGLTDVIIVGEESGPVVIRKGD
jgi:ribose 5-phosphate isomerase A